MKTNKGLEGTVSIQTLALDLATGEFSLEGINFVSQSIKIQLPVSGLEGIMHRSLAPALPRGCILSN